MPISKNKLYLILFIACFVGYLWLFYAGVFSSAGELGLKPCFLKSITGIPCPSCGSTRGVISIIKGDFQHAFLANPLAFVIAIVLIITPFWLVFDILTRRSTLYFSYLKLERFIKKPIIAIPLILMFIIIWIWNIVKGI